ncbi:MAG: hypothetical protein RR400_03295 [Clostridia bacterium]
MEIEKCSHKIKCDFSGCENLAEYSLKKEEGQVIDELHFCSECIKNMYEKMGSVLVPKAIENPLKNYGKKVVNYGKTGK